MKRESSGAVMDDVGMQAQPEPRQYRRHSPPGLEGSGQRLYTAAKRHRGALLSYCHGAFVAK